MNRSLSREQLLAEMGITPIWRLRTPGAVIDGGTEAPASLEPERPETRSIKDTAAAANHDARQNGAIDLPQHLHADRTPPGSVAAMDWAELEKAVAGCRACVLCEHRNQAVLGVGDRQAEWLVIGEGPGAEEDVQGEPFVGQAGKLLDNMLAALDLKRGDKVYIANAVKCRPPGNRTPEAEEMAACRPFLERQIALLKPRVILLLGKAAAGTILAEEGALGGLRGKRFSYRGIPVAVTYHPAYLLRSLPEKAKAWEDLLFARRLLREAAGNPAEPELPL